MYTRIRLAVGKLAYRKWFHTDTKERVSLATMVLKYTSVYKIEQELELAGCKEMNRILI